MNEQTQVTDNSNDRKYFTLTPRLVWALCDDPYEFTLWSVVRDVAGESGECYLSREQLATLAMMSHGKVSYCRNSLIRKGLLQGELRKDPGYPQPVWHLRIPDLWRRNVEWCEQHPGIFERLEFKKSRHVVTAEKEPSPHDGGMPPHDAKKNPKKNQKEEPQRAGENFSSVSEWLLKRYGEVISNGKPPIKSLADAEAKYPRDWLESALNEAEGHDPHSWKYIAAILSRYDASGGPSQPARGNGEQPKGKGSPVPDSYSPEEVQAARRKASFVEVLE